MIGKRHLSNAPIKEALIDIQVALSGALATEALDSKYERLASDYPKHETLQRGEFGLHYSEGQPTKAAISHSLVGYRYTSQDGKHVVQFRRDGYTFSRLEPYHTWEEMKEEAARLWQAYVEAATPSVITRIATRYVNVMELPLPTELAQYLTAPPAIPLGLNQELSGFFSRVEIREPSIKARGIITQVLESGREDYASVVLDIDVFMTRQFEVENDEHWQCLDKLRDFKNTVFFKSITQTAAEQFK
ncbi:MAG: TIGR04255 family protein [Gammaproteobacteria bacterium]